MAALCLSGARRKLPAAAFSSSFGSSRYLSLSPSPAPSQETTTPDPRFLLHHSSSDATPFPDHSPFLRFPEVRLSTLPSGLRVVTQTAPSSATHTASLGVWIDAGSRFEAPGTNGTAHFLEHMIFKGTRRRTARSLEVEIENMGGRLNAYTSREQTTFFADVQSKDVPLAIDVLADILQNSNFPEHAIKRERGVILREMKEVQEQTQEVLFDHLHSAAFHGHPLGDTILGPEENILRISRVDLRQYISTHYTGPRMVISAAGAVNHEEIVNMVGRLFTNFSSDPTTADQLVAANPAVFTGCEVRVEDNEMPLAHFVVTFKGSSWTEPSSIPLMVIQSLLGSWEKNTGVGSCSGSQLARRVGTDDLAHSFMAFNTNYSDTGLFGVFLSAMPSCLYDLSNVLMEEIRRLAFQVSDEEVTRARNQLKSAMLLHIDGSTAVSENNGRQMLTYRRVMPFIEFFARVDAVDAAVVMETARNFIIDKDVAVAAMGPIRDLPDSTWFRSRTAA
ncbi:probable mitochondrial-processing peptidase subunit beta, mitochondrial [Zingiber officinale]|uniref:probable mitochondrial-processing peptidase subunit beta, mitochondrial n=1 Tax=Zingiber officinale TaxID=94328 RepID=UPI001C4C2614|nr:probable mitochondrial-processing peptidase subunit beta, mitochondrial [Zingiber officinale]XP_042373099.1 probable mitochondrial-processing peptidase subunit beta, mitochondrial [Zingiber officinale]